MRSSRLAKAVVLVFLIGWPAMSKIVWAQSEDTESEYTQVPPGIEDRDIPGRGKHRGWIKGRHKGWQHHKEELFKLKEENPEKFEELVGRRQTEVKERLEKLREEDPERYKRLRQRIHHRRKMRMHKLKEENPEKFKKTLKARKKHLHRRLETLKTKDPEKYEAITKHHRLKKHLPRHGREDTGDRLERTHREPKRIRKMGKPKRVR